MVVKAMYEFEFEPDTSELDGVIDDKKGFTLDLAKRELDSMLHNKDIDSRDFHFTVIDDGNDHNIELPKEDEIYHPNYFISEEANNLFEYLDSKIPITSNGVNINNTSSDIEQKYFIPYDNIEEHISAIKRIDRCNRLTKPNTLFELAYGVPENNYRYDDIFGDCNATYYDIRISKPNKVINVYKTHYDNDGFIDNRILITDSPSAYVVTERLCKNVPVNSVDNIHDHADEINSICKSCLNYLQNHDVL